MIWATVKARGPRSLGRITRLDPAGRPGRPRQRESSKSTGENTRVERKSRGSECELSLLPDLDRGSLRYSSTDSRWDDLKKQSAEKKYAEQQLDNQNDVRSRWHRAAQAAARLQTGDALEPLESTPEERGSSDAPELDDDTLRDRRATFWGSLSIGKAEERDENEELPYQSKALEQQHW